MVKPPLKPSDILVIKPSGRVPQHIVDAENNASLDASADERITNWREEQYNLRTRMVNIDDPNQRQDLQDAINRIERSIDRELKDYEKREKRRKRT